MAKLTQIQTKGSLADKAYYVLKDAILSLDLKPGQILIEEELSEQLGISRTPLRSALLRLSYENLVEITPGKGTHVTDLSIKYIMDLFTVREAMELLAVKLATTNRTKEDISEMKKLVKIQCDITKAKTLDIYEYMRIDRMFHHAIAKASKNQILEEQTVRLMEGYNRYLLSVPFHDRAKVVVKEHIVIINEIEKGNAEKAQKIMKEHILDVRESLVSGVEKGILHF